MFIFKKIKNIVPAVFYYLANSRFKHFLSLNNSKYKVKTKKIKFFKATSLKFKFLNKLSKNRLFYQTFLFKKKRRQYRLTKYFNANKFRSTKYLYRSVLQNLINVLQYSYFCYSRYQALYFIKNGFVFLNGNLITRPFVILLPFDRINFIISHNYFSYIRTQYFCLFKL